MNSTGERFLLPISVLLMVVAFYLRLLFIPYSNGDMSEFNLVWYHKLASEGILHTLGTNFSNYTPPYTYLLALVTLTKGIFAPLTAVKLIPICFDILNSFIVYLIVKLRYPAGNIPFLAAAIYFSAPTIVINSSLWGQVDSLYTAFLLLCVYSLMRQKPWSAILYFGIASSIKAQAIFLVPFLALMMLHRRISLVSLVVIPLTYLAAILPTVLLGRSFTQALLIYASQSGTYKDLARNAPNLYLFFPNDWYSIVVLVGLIAAFLGLSYWVYTSVKTDGAINHEKIMFYALTSVMLTPFLLPKMHDRYFYPADAMAIPFAFFWPQLWFIPLGLQLSSSLAYTGFLYQANFEFIAAAAIINIILVAVLLRTQRLAWAEDRPSFQLEAPFRWFTSVIALITLLMGSLRLIATPMAFQVGYRLLHMSDVKYTFTRQEQYFFATVTLDYILGHKNHPYLDRLSTRNGDQLFGTIDQEKIQKLRSLLENVVITLRLATVATLAAGLLAWATGYMRAFKNGLYLGGAAAQRLAILLAALLTIMLILGGPMSSVLRYEGVASGVFPFHFWVGLFGTGCAILFAMGTILQVFVNLMDKYEGRSKNTSDKVEGL